MAVEPRISFNVKESEKIISREETDVTFNRIKKLECKEVHKVNSITDKYPVGHAHLNP